MPRFLFEYLGSRTLLVEETLGNQFYTLIMAAMRCADTDNLAKLKDAFPEVYQELVDRYNAPGGLLPGEEVPVSWR